MVDHGLVKLGRTRASLKTLRGIPKIANVFGPRLAPSLPSVDYTKGHTNDWGMHLNGPNNYSDPTLPAASVDQIREGLGCCTMGGLLNLEEIWTVNCAGFMMNLGDKCCLQKYCQWCGYVPGNPSTDNGGVEPLMLDHAKSKWGVWNHRILGYADPSNTDLEHSKKAIELFGALYIGVALPIEWQGKQVWDAVGTPASWGLHCVVVPKYDTSAGRGMISGAGANTAREVRFFAISWGELYEITQAAWTFRTQAPSGSFVDEIHAPLGQDWLRWKGMPEGVDLSQLSSDLPQIAD